MNAIRGFPLATGTRIGKRSLIECSGAKPVAKMSFREECLLWRCSFQMAVVECGYSMEGIPGDAGCANLPVANDFIGGSLLGGPGRPRRSPWTSSNSTKDAHSAGQNPEHVPGHRIQPYFP
ncbi:hypothetical protein CEXT_449951 [Caerostris extrusa]|uniref:Uncharacterized protein n=1 Tax=Caerostris extrusa TaxID=172846 RepID=A0AAV4XZD2_CAEEX|nr:hypothetical protein CEXT_449951 [Caerostris extrusa]